MSGDYVFSGDEQVAVGKSNVSRSDKILKRVLFFLALILIVELIWLFGITPCMPFSRIDMRGLSNINGINEELVIIHSGLSPQSSFVNTNTRKIQKALESLYMVESASVKKRFPDSLLIEMSPRTAVAFFVAPANGRLTPVFLDREGVIFSIGAISDDLKAMVYRLPVISGLVFENLRLGVRLPEMLKPFFYDLERINAYNPDLLAGISEIRIHKKEYDGFELVLYPVHSQVRFRVGAELNEEVLRYMMLVIDVLNDQGAVTEEEIDFRTGTASYKIKEVTSG